jgi:hypothetical protein
MPRDPYIREKFTREHGEARRVAQEYFAKYPKDRYRTEVESWRHLQSRNYEFTMKRLREPRKTDATVDLDGIQQWQPNSGQFNCVFWKQALEQAKAFAGAAQDEST